MKSERMLIAVLLLVVSGCEMDDQPRRSPLQESHVFSDGSSAREGIPHTVSVEAPPGNPTMNGKQGYETFCSPCHGTAGEGDGPVIERGFPKPPPISPAASRDAFVRVILDGKGHSPPFSGALNNDEAREIAAYLQSLRSTSK